MESSNPWLERRVLASAHRCGAHEAPASTLAGARHALQAGADVLELDIHASLDGVLVCCHDATLDATTNGGGPIAERRNAEIQRLDAAWWFVPGEGEVQGRDDGAYPLRGLAAHDPDYRVPALEDVLDAFPGVLLSLDIKQTAPAVPGYEATLAGLLRRYGRADDVAVGSFSELALERFEKLAPEVTTAAPPGVVAALWRSARAGTAPLPALRHRILQVPSSFAGVQVVDEAFTSAAHRAGSALHVWTVNDPHEMGRLVSCGVDGIISDRPTVLVRALEERGCRWPERMAGPAGGRW